MRAQRVQVPARVRVVRAQHERALEVAARLGHAPLVHRRRCQRREADLDRLDPGVRRIINPHIYHVSLTQNLWNLKEDLIKAVRKRA